MAQSTWRNDAAHRMWRNDVAHDVMQRRDATMRIYAVELMRLTM
jgi:hypothetical protein